MRRHRERKKQAEAAGRGQGKPFEPGHQVSVRHGAYSQRLTGERAREIAGTFLASAACPSDAADDLTLMSAIAAWAHAESECERLRGYRDVLESQLGDDAVAEMLTEVTETTRVETRPAMGSMQGKDLTRTRESTARALYRAEMKLRTMRTDLWKQLDKHGTGRQPFSLALIMAEQDEAEQDELGSSAG